MSEDTPVPAATILLLRDDPSFSVAMIERNANTGFAGGALVFPGGRIDEADYDDAWRAHGVGLSEDPPALRAAKVAAIREAYEETGIVIAVRNGEPVSQEVVDAVQSERAAVEERAALFLQLAIDCQFHLAADDLRLFARWVAPPGLHRRFDTWFFAAPAPAGQRLREDGSEATEALWVEPGSALEDRETGKRKIIFPTARNLELLNVSASRAEALQSCAERKIEPVQPSVVSRPDGEYLTIPGDLGYPVTEEPLDRALRH